MNNILNVNSAGIVSLTVLMMSLVMSYLEFISDRNVSHSDSAFLVTNPELSWKLGENVAKISLIRNGKIPDFWQTKILFLVAKFFRAYPGIGTYYECVGCCIGTSVA